MARVLRIAGLLLLHAGIIGAAFPEFRIWGVHAIGFLPRWAELLILGLGGLFLVGFGRKLYEKLSAGLKVLTNRSAWLWVLLALAVFFGLRISVPLLGDSQLWIRELTWIGELDEIGGKVKEGRIFMRKEPLSLAVHEGLFEALRMVYPYKPSVGPQATKNEQRNDRLNYFRDLARNSYSTMSMVAGAMTVLILILFARKRLPKEGRASFFLMMLSGGGLLLFFGYIENYSWTSFWMIACLLAGISEAEAGVNFPWKTSLVFLIALGFHYAAILLLPGVLFLILNLGLRSRDLKHKQTFAPDKRIWQFIIGFAVAGLAGYIYVEGWEGWISIIPLLPQWSKDGYSFVSPAHWGDLLNLFALCALAATAAVLSLKPTESISHAGRTQTGFLKLCAGAGVVFVLLFSPNLGMARDWDILAMSLWPLLVLAAWQIANTASINRTALNSILLGIVILSAVPYVIVNSNYEASIARFKTLLEIDESRAAYGWENLALHYQRRGEIENRVDAWRHAVEIERNPRYVFNYADALKLAGRIEDAVPFYIEAAREMKDSDIKIYREQLLYIAARLITETKFIKAREVVDAAIEVMPDNEHAHRLLLMLDDAATVDSLIKSGDYEAAKAATLAARDKDPQNSYWVGIYNKIKRLSGER